MLPLALNELAKRTDDTGFTVSAAIIVPQVVVALFSPWVGRFAERIGRKRILLFGFAALPLRGLLFMTLPDSGPLIVMEVLDGISGTVFGLMIPLVAADLTRTNRLISTLTISSFNLAIGLGAMLSTTHRRMGGGHAWSACRFPGSCHRRVHRGGGSSGR